MPQLLALIAVVFDVVVIVSSCIPKGLAFS